LPAEAGYSALIDLTVRLFRISQGQIGATLEQQNWQEDLLERGNLWKADFRKMQEIILIFD
jgi:hypothetical protein